MNQDKTTICFSKNVEEDTKNAIQARLNIPEIKEFEKYLGMPSFVGRNKKASFSNIKERVWRVIQGWGEKMLSQAGKEILIKAVAQAIPPYVISCFRLATSLCKDLEIMIREFWWGGDDRRHKSHWVNWERLCKPKFGGGLGFRNIKKFNEALLAKQFLRLLNSSSSLAYKVFQHRFFKEGNILKLNDRAKGSYAWNSIKGVKHLIEVGSRWRIGRGNTVKIWGDPWLSNSHTHKVQSPISHLPHDAKVEELIDWENMRWRDDLIDQIF